MKDGQVVSLYANCSVFAQTRSGIDVVELIVNIGWQSMVVKVIFQVNVQHLERSNGTAGTLVITVIRFSIVTISSKKIRRRTIRIQISNTIRKSTAKIIIFVL